MGDGLGRCRLARPKGPGARPGQPDQEEQQELIRLVKKSKGRPGTLPQRDRTRLKNIAGKAIHGSK
jgi:hypothetical protein